MLPFKKLPMRFVVEMVYLSNFWLNVFPATDRVSGVTSLREIITGLCIDFFKH